MLLKNSLFKRSLCLISIALILSACSPSNTAKQQTLPSSTHIVSPWYELSYSVFIDNEYDNIEGFASKLSGLLGDVNSEPAGMENAWLAPDVLTIEQANNQQSSARSRLFESMQKMFVAHNMASFGKTMLSVNDTSFIQQNQEWKAFIESLSQLGNMNNIFSKGEFEIYAANTTTGLFAYQRTFEGKRAYIAFNLSFDVHEMPLPLGFMSSTKITLWQTDAPDIKQFVTSAPLAIRPFTGAIVFVN
jgi:hypothetical protein